MREMAAFHLAAKGSPMRLMQTMGPKAHFVSPHNTVELEPLLIPFVLVKFHMVSLFEFNSHKAALLQLRYWLENFGPRDIVAALKVNH